MHHLPSGNAWARSDKQVGSTPCWTCSCCNPSSQLVVQLKGCRSSAAAGEHHRHNPSTLVGKHSYCLFVARTNVPQDCTLLSAAMALYCCSHLRASLLVQCDLQNTPALLALMTQSSAEARLGNDLCGASSQAEVPPLHLPRRQPVRHSRASTQPCALHPSHAASACRQLPNKEAE